MLEVRGPGYGDQYTQEFGVFHSGSIFPEQSSENNMSRRQTEGGETWRRLRDWERGQAPSERLAAHILRIEGYAAIDPSHPLGGQDGLKDIVCVKDKVKFIGACYFPRGQQIFRETNEKFANDLEGVVKNNAEGIIFVTNQELTLGEREQLIKKAGSAKVDLFHLERMASILDSPQCYGIRLEFLDIEMTKEEQLAFMATFSQLTNRFEEILSYINQSEVLREELKKLSEAQDKPKAPQYVTPSYINSWSLWGPYGGGMKKCSHCGYGYIVRGEYLYGLYGKGIVSCPKCGSAEYA